MEPKGIKTHPKIHAVFVSRFRPLLSAFWLQKCSFLGDILSQKQVFFKKCQPCENTAPATQIQGSGPSKRVKIVSKIVTFADMVPGPVLERFFIDFGTHFGSLFGIKMVQKGTKTGFYFQNAFWVPPGGSWRMDVVGSVS